MDTRLILVDGLPGSGKSSTAQFLGDQLRRSGISCRWYYEEEPYHPVVAGYRTSGYDTPEDFIAFARRKWDAFVSQAAASDQVSIVEAWTFQDAIFGMVSEDIDESYLHDHIHSIVQACQPLNPSLIYLVQPDYSVTMRRILDHRGKGIERAYIRRAQNSVIGQRLGLQGFEGLVTFWDTLGRVLDRVFAELPIPKLSIDIAEREWDRYHRQVCDFLGLPFTPPFAPSLRYLDRFAGNYAANHQGEIRQFSIRRQDGHLVIHGAPWL